MDLNEKRVQKERGATPKELLRKYLEIDDIESIVIISKYSDGEMSTELSANSTDESLVMLSKAYHTEVNYGLGMYDDD